MPRVEFLQMPVLIFKVKNHQEIKQQLLNDIDMMGKHSAIEPHNDQIISNTDWHLNSNHDRKYFSVLSNLIYKTIDDIKSNLLMNDYNLVLSNFWFQQYENNDYHGWHQHNDCFYSNVYYAELPTGSSKTSFRIMNKEYQFDVTEGDIISFPGSILHCSKPNLSKKRKTVVAFNTQLK